jgi:DNA-directed RNA polymerase subunit beta
MKKNFISNIGDLSDIQHVSYYQFLLKGLESELKSLKEGKTFLNPEFLIKNICYKLYLFSQNIKFAFPEQNFAYFDRTEETYSLHAYIPVFYSCKEVTKDLNFLQKKKKLNNNLIKKVKKSKINNIIQDNFNAKKKKLKTIYCCGDVYLCEIPLMTQEGTFLITGCERVVISQMIRSPGIYFRRENGPLKKVTICTATIISDKGLWTKFSLKTAENHLLKFSINISDLLGKFIFSNKQIKIAEAKDISIFSFFKYFNISIEEVKSCLTIAQLKILSTFIQETQFEKENTFEHIENILNYTFYNSKRGCFSIGEIGRKNINEKFKYNTPKFIKNVCGSDFIFILKKIIDLKYFGMPADNIDHIKNKKIRPIGALMQNQFRIGYLNALNDITLILKRAEIFQTKNRRLKKNLDNLLYVNTIKIWEVFIHFFKLSDISQYMDQTNSLAEMSHKRRISVFGPNGLKRDSISIVIRDIHPSQYAKICPIETPEGETAGLVSSLAMLSRFNHLGYIETPCYQLEKEKINIDQPSVYLNSQLEINENIGFCDICVDNKNSKIVQSSLYAKNNTYFSIFEKKNINFVTISPMQLLSLATNLVPFIEHDDANRGLMGANMQRQAVPLFYSQKPIVGTGFESNAISDSAMILVNYSEGEIIKSTSDYIYVKDNFYQKLKYILKKNVRSNQDTWINQQACVWTGEHVFSNQIIADGGGTLDGEFSIGKNLTIAYMPWDGYNFEDAIIINEKLIINNSLTSVNIQEYQTSLDSDFFENTFIVNDSKKEALFKYIQNFEIIPKDLLIQIFKLLLNFNNKKDFKKIILSEIISSLEKNKNIKNFNTLKTLIYSYFNKMDIYLHSDKIVNSSKLEKIKLKKKKNLKKNLDYNLISDEKNISDDFEVEEDIISKETYLAKFHLSDYEQRNLNSYGIINKGSYVNSNDILASKVKAKEKCIPGQLKLMIALMNPKENEHYTDCSFRLPEQIEGRVIDIRLFFQQVSIENSNISEDSDTNEEVTKTSLNYEKLKFFIAQIRKIEIGDKLAGRHGNKGVISKIVCQQDMPFLPDGTPIDIIFNPLGVPSRMNVGQIFESLLGFAGFHLGKRFRVTPFDELFGEDSSRILVNQKLKEARLTAKKKWIYSTYSPGKILLRDGRTGEFFDNPIFVGKSYIIKLIHLVEDKQHARSVGPYSSITEQPLSGKSFEGGQRFGEMETWALEGFGSSMILNELFTLKSDDMETRNNFYNSVIQNKFENKPNPIISETFLTLTRELNALGLDFNQKKINLLKSSNISVKEVNLFNDIEHRLELIALIKKTKIRALIKSKVKEKEIKILEPTKLSNKKIENFLDF